MEINMKTIYKGFKEDIQKHIKEIAEKYCIDPIQVLTRFDEAVTSDLDNKLEIMGAELHTDYSIDPIHSKQFFEEFKSEVFDFICPDWNSTIKNDSLNTYLNRRLMEEGYDTIPFEMLDFLFEEFQQMKPAKEVEVDE